MSYNRILVYALFCNLLYSLNNLIRISRLLGFKSQLFHSLTASLNLRFFFSKMGIIMASTAWGLCEELNKVST